MALTVLKSLNEAFHTMMADDDRVIIMGEDLLDPYGGAFKVTKGLSTAFEDRVWTTPISEAGFVGVATGMAMRGLRPVVEIMFGDFVLLAADQLINHAAKFRWMYGDKVDVPLVVRVPMGGHRGYGPTHSQTLEKHFFGVPGLGIVAIHPLVDPGQILKQATLKDIRPQLFVENKTMYARRLRLPIEGRIGPMVVRQTEGPYPTMTLGFGDRDKADVTVVAYGGMVEMALETAERLLIEEEIYSEVVVPIELQPLDMEPIISSVAHTGRLVVCEEASAMAGFGAEVCTQVATEAFELLKAAPVRVAAAPVPIANTPTLERASLPGTEDIFCAVRNRLSGPRRSVKVSLG